MSLYEASVPQLKRMLHNLTTWFDKAEAHATSKKYDTSVLLNARLAPDQYSLTRQVQIATDAAKLGMARLTGKQAPSFEDNETTLVALRARIEKTIAFLDTLGSQDFAGAEDRKVVTPAFPGKYALGQDHLFQHVLPTFYFHVTTAYAILRHNGIDLGKADYLGPRTVHDA